MESEAYEERLTYQALMQRLCPGHDAAQPLTLEECICMYIDDVFDALEDPLVHGGQHG
ncbi:hypothetical protein [Azohydromonas australica]|uniref:hypothetical protein n=1 Tax=Azohydromonas australica TaxID=364039 RepID=UPI00041A0728|nr:hypothetical protein [Azohydromonas australica]